MKEKQEVKMEGFTIKLALVDFITVAIFSVSATIIGSRLGSLLFVLGAVFSGLAGCGKVAWKIIIAVKHRRYDILFYQFRALMPAGFILMFAGAFTSGVTLKMFFEAVTKMPSAIFFGLTLLTFVVLVIMGMKLDKTNAKHNWIEQFTNILAQLFILIGIIVG